MWYVFRCAQVIHSPQSTLFDEYRIESKNNNEIAFEISLDNLLKALKSGQLASNIILKLTKLDQVPYMRISIDIQSVRDYYFFFSGCRE